jgi:hypothetical protein
MAEWHVFGALCRGSGVVPLRRRRAGPRGTRVPLAGASTICPACGRRGDDGDRSADADSKTLWPKIREGITIRARKCVGLAPHDPYPTYLPQGIGPYWLTALFIRQGDDGSVDGLVNARR